MRGCQLAGLPRPPRAAITASRTPVSAPRHTAASERVLQQTAQRLVQKQAALIAVPPRRVRCASTHRRWRCKSRRQSLPKVVETSGPCSVTVLNGGSGPELQTIGDKRRQATHQCMQTCRFRLDHRQEGAAIAAGKILVIIENLCSRLDRSNPIQEFLFCILVLTQIQSSGDTSNLRHASSLIWAAWHELGRGEAWFFKRHFWKNQSKIYAGTTTLWQLCSRVDRPNFKDTPQNLRTVRSSLNCYTEIRRYRVVFHDDLMCLRTEGGPTNRVTTRRAALSAILHDVK